MADDKKLQGKEDRNKVAGNEEYEVRYLAEKLGIPERRVREAIQAVGNDREAVEKYLKGNH